MNVGILSKHTNIVDLKISFGLNSYVNFSTAFFRKNVHFAYLALVKANSYLAMPCLNETWLVLWLCMFIIHNLNATMHVPVLLTKERSVYVAIKLVGVDSWYVI